MNKVFKKRFVNSLAYGTVILLLLALSGCSGKIEKAVSYFSVSTPRPFGYVIGDEIQQQIHVVVRHGFTIDASSLPEKGQINRWLNLKTIQIKKSNVKQGISYQIDLTYQLFYAPLEVKMLTIPSFQLLINQGINQVQQAVPNWYFTVAPLRELAVRKDDKGEYMRPDAIAPLFDNQPLINRLIFYFSVLIISAIYLLFLHGHLSSFKRQTIFKRAYQKINRTHHDSTEKLLKIMHQALNELNQAPVFKHTLNDFFKQHKAYTQLNAELNWFYDYSNQYHFSQQPSLDQQSNDKIRHLCKQCLAIERGIQ